MGREQFVKGFICPAKELEDSEVASLLKTLKMDK